MTFKHVFWVDAMAFNNQRDRLRFVFIACTVLSSTALLGGSNLTETFARISPIATCTFILASVLFLIALSFYINTALQGVERTDEWANDGDRDGRYWTEQLFLGNTILLSLFLFLEWAFNQELFTAEGAFTSSQLLIELPLAYLMFTAMVVGAAYSLLFVVFLIIGAGLAFMKKEDVFAGKKKTLFHAWAACSEKQSEQLAVKMALVEDAVKQYPNLTNRQKAKSKKAIDEMFDYLIEECHTLVHNKNLLK